MGILWISMMWVIQCHKAPIWEWSTYHLTKIVIWGMVYCIALPTLVIFPLVV